MSLSADRLGMIVSTVCAVHCAVGPILFALLPWADVYAGPWARGLEGVLLGLAAGLAAVAFGIGYRTHRDARVGLWFLGGFSCIGLGAFGRVPEVFAVVGAICLIVGHFQNQRLCRCAACPSCGDRGRQVVRQ